MIYLSCVGVAPMRQPEEEDVCKNRTEQRHYGLQQNLLIKDERKSTDSNFQAARSSERHPNFAVYKYRH